MATIRPPRCFSIGFKDAWHRVKVAVRLVASTASQSSRFIRSNSVVARDAGVAHHDVDPAVPGDDARHRRLDSSSIGDVERQQLGAAAGRHDGIDGLFRVLAARGGNHHRALTGQRLGNRAADAA